MGYQNLKDGTNIENLFYLISNQWPAATMPATRVTVANPGQEGDWGPSGTREKPTGLPYTNTIRHVIPRWQVDEHLHCACAARMARQEIISFQTTKLLTQPITKTSRDQ